jgi:hypothetical protein
MQEDNSRLQQRLKIAAYLLIAGLIVEVITLYWFSPLSFMLFIGGGGSLVVLGVLLYLITIVTG